MTSEPLRIAHRGMPLLARENTLHSFEMALQAGADGIELDVHASRDAVVVVHHDPALDNGLVIARESFDSLRGDRHGDVPELSEVCALVSGTAELFVEVKGAGIERQVLEVMDGYDGPFAIHSFDHALVARIHSIAPKVRLGVLFEELPTDIAELMTRTGAKDVWPHAPIITSRLVDAVHAASGRVIAWTVNDVDVARHLSSIGVDGLCGDDVRLLARG